VRPSFLRIILLAASALGAQAPPAEISHASKPQNSVRSTAVEAGGYIYISGQIGRRSDGKIPDKFEEQASQALENIKTIAQSFSLDMDHVVYLQVYLEDVNNSPKLQQVFAKYFPDTPPAGAVLGVSRVPQSAIEINAVVVRDLTGRKAISTSNYKSSEPFSPGILTHDRLFISAMQGRDPATGAIPVDPAAQTDFALDGFKAVVESAGLTLGNVVFVNPYLTQKIPSRVMNERYARRFEFGNTPARATIEVNALPHDLQIEYTGVAVRDLRLRRAVRPKNMPPSPTASPCVFAGETLYCSAKSGFIPGPNGGVYGGTTAVQLRQTMRNQLDNLEEADMDFSQVVSTTVYLDDLSDIDAFDQVYTEYFKGTLPAQIVIQQRSPEKRSADQEGHFPDLEQMSLIAVKPPPKN
jgi:enamine deaminase RidA (YjgF/YER057c/UK114 family)